MITSSNNNMMPFIPNPKKWLGEVSLDLTESSVSSDGQSIVSFYDDDSLDTSLPLLVETPAPSTKLSKRRVRFACRPDGSVRCHTKIVSRVGDPTLWWTEDDMKDILQDCAQVVYFYQGRTRLCTTMTNILTLRWLEDDPLDAIYDFVQNLDPEIGGRGLEQHVVGSSKYYVNKHRYAVLTTQEEVRGTKNENALETSDYISQAALETSSECKNLARRLAILDKQEARDGDDC